MQCKHTVHYYIPRKHKHSKISIFGEFIHFTTNICKIDSTSLLHPCPLKNFLTKLAPSTEAKEKVLTKAFLKVSY